MNYTILQGDNKQTLKTIEDDSIDAIVTDPPYGIDFLGKDWDANTGALETYQECLRVLKPGGYVLAFSAARTYHHLAVTLEQAGFEIRDQLMWLYSSGFAKGIDIGKALDRKCIDNKSHGWKTSLKPAHEPICMARKPFKGSAIDNVLKYGVGALNIDQCRELSDSPAYPNNVIGTVEGYQKFYYCPKVSRKERHMGFDNLNEIPTEQTMLDQMGGYYIDSQGQKQSCAGKQIWLPQTGNIYVHGLKEEYSKWCAANNHTYQAGNDHSTVKPVALMRYLIGLVTPANSTVLDPFCGSGSTGMAAVELGHTFIGCELDPKYVEIAKTRIAAWNSTDETYEEFFE